MVCGHYTKISQKPVNDLRQYNLQSNNICETYLLSFHFRQDSISFYDIRYKIPVEYMRWEMIFRFQMTRSDDMS
jgi:hypothetical protein